MKQLFLLCLTALLFTACQQQEQRYFAESAETNTLKAGIAAYEAGDWEKWRSHFADTAKIYVNSLKSVSVAERSEGLEKNVANFSSYGFNHDKEYIEMVIDKEKEKWVYYWATWNGELKANKKKLSVPVHLAVQFLDGKIVEEHVYFDGTEMTKAMEELANETAEPEQ